MKQYRISIHLFISLTLAILAIGTIPEQTSTQTSPVMRMIIGVGMVGMYCFIFHSGWVFHKLRSPSPDKPILSVKIYGVILVAFYALPLAITGTYQFLTDMNLANFSAMCLGLFSIHFVVLGYIFREYQQFIAKKA